MFDSLTELIEKIILGEDSTIEFKRELPRRKDLADEIAAFANARGGVILIGVNDYGDIVGIDRKDLDQIETTVLEACRDSIEPMVSIFTEKLQIDEKILLKIDVPHSLFVHRSLAATSPGRAAANESCPPTSWRGCCKAVHRRALSHSMNGSCPIPTEAPCEKNFISDLSQKLQRTRLKTCY